MVRFDVNSMGWGLTPSLTPSLTPTHNQHVPPPADEYRARLEARGAAHAALSATDLRFSQARLAVFGLLVLVIVLASVRVVSAAWIVAPVLGLAVLIQRHDGVVRRRE